MGSSEASSRSSADAAWRSRHGRRLDLPARGDDSAREPARRPRVFTEYVRALSSPEGRQEAEALLPEVWSALRAVAVSELRRRGLWEVPPVYLGFPGWSVWESLDGGALEELVSACYESNFVVRLGGLARHLDLKDNIDGLVFLNVRNLLHALQLRHDPVGARVFETLRNAVRSLIDEGRARVLSGSPELLNDTVVGLVPDAPESPAAAPELEVPVTAWSDELIPDLLTARGEEERAATVRTLAERIRGLTRAGFGTVRIRDLIEPLRTAVRARWAAVLARTEERIGIDPGAAADAGEHDREFGGLALGYRPDRLAETWDSYLKLTDCVAQTLERLRVRAATAGHLGRLWQYLRLYSLDPGERLPSRRALAALLEIPRNRLPGLYRVLGRLVEACREASAAGRPVTGSDMSYGLDLEGAS